MPRATIKLERAHTLLHWLKLLFRRGNDANQQSGDIRVCSCLGVRDDEARRPKPVGPAPRGEEVLLRREVVVVLDSRQLARKSCRRRRRPLPPRRRIRLRPRRHHFQHRRQRGGGSAVARGVEPVVAGLHRLAVVSVA